MHARVVLEAFSFASSLSLVCICIGMYMYIQCIYIYIPVTCEGLATQDTGGIVTGVLLISIEPWSNRYRPVALHTAPRGITLSLPATRRASLGATTVRDSS